MEQHKQMRFRSAYFRAMRSKLPQAAQLHLRQAKCLPEYRLCQAQSPQKAHYALSALM